MESVVKGKMGQTDQVARIDSSDAPTNSKTRLSVNEEVAKNFLIFKASNVKASSFVPMDVALTLPATEQEVMKVWTFLEIVQEV